MTRARSTIDTTNPVPLVLSRAELVALSGYRQRARIMDWLALNRIPYRTGADGLPRVLRTDVALTVQKN